MKKQPIELTKQNKVPSQILQGGGGFTTREGVKEGSIFGGNRVFVARMYRVRASRRVFTSKNNPWRQVSALRLAHLAHIISTTNQEASTYSNYHWAQLAPHHIFRASPSTTPYLQGVPGAPRFLPGTS